MATSETGPYDGRCAVRHPQITGSRSRSGTVGGCPARVRAATLIRTADLPLLVTAPLLTASGLDLDIARRAVARGAWTQVLPGAWLRTDGEPSRAQREAAALALAPHGTLLTGPGACRRYGMRDVPDDDRVFLAVGPEVRLDLGPHVVLLRTGRSPESYVTGGVRTASPVRAVVDAARHAGSLQDVRALVLAAVAGGWCDEPALREELDAGPRRGSGRCRIALDDAADGARSAPEAELAEHAADAVRQGQLPPFLMNPDLLLDGVLLVSPDLYLPGLGLGGELDSVRHHGSADDLDHTLDRHDHAWRSGVELLHVSPSRFRRNPAAFLARLAAQVPERRALAAPEPRGLVVVPRGPLLPVDRRRRQGAR